MSAVDPADYVLGMLEGDDLREARRLEAEDPAFAAEVRALSAVGSRLDALQADEWDAVGPPPLRVDVAAGPERVREPRRSLTAGLRERLGAAVSVRPAVALACALLLVGIGAGAGLLAAGDEGAPPASRPAGAVVALDRFGAGPAGASGTATVSAAGGVPEVTIDTRGLKPSAPGTSYEVWMIRDARRMVGLGRFKVGPGGRATVTLPVTVSPADYPIMDVSVEPDGGPAGHSGVSVLRSPARPA